MRRVQISVDLRGDARLSANYAGLNAMRGCQLITGAFTAEVDVFTVKLERPLLRVAGAILDGLSGVAYDADAEIREVLVTRTRSETPHAEVILRSVNYV